jgi:hypothetical protein
VIPVIEKLVTAIQSRWHAANFDEPRFPVIAAEELGDARLSEHLDIPALVRWFGQETGAAPQINLEGTFGEPPLTLAATSRFYIEALFWLDGTTSIHQHQFSGAFSVLCGSSIHTRYRFARSQRVNASTLVGALAVDGVEFMRPGQVRPILSGNGTIHSLFHLERPTVSIVVRTFVDHEAGPQFDYWPPSIARAPYVLDTRLTRQLQLLRTLCKIEASDRFQHARELLERSDYASALMVVDAILAAEPAAWPEILELIELVRARHPAIDCDLVPVFEVRRRAYFVAGQRRQVRDPELRLFLAMLLVLPTRAACFEFLRTYAPDRDPERLLASWIDRLAELETTAEQRTMLFRPLTQ